MPRQVEPAERSSPAIGRRLDERQLADLLSLMPDAALVVDIAGTIVAANERCEAMSGYEASALAGKPIEFLVPGRLADLHRKYRAGYSANPHARPMGSGLNLYLRKSDGTSLPVDISLAPVKVEGGLLVVAGVRDMTERKTVERRLRLQARSEAAAAEIRLELLSGGPVEASLRLVCKWAMELAGARAAAIVSYNSQNEDRPALLSSDGDKEVLTALAKSLVERASYGEGPPGGGSHGEGPHGEGPHGERYAGTGLGGGLAARAMPVAGPKGKRAFRVALIVVVEEDRPIEPERAAELESLTSQAVLALELATVRAERDRMAISAERERIARDLHDLVIQRLFGAGLRLQGALSLIDNQAAVGKVASTVDDLDTTIKEIRESIFALEAAPGAGLRPRVEEVVGTAAEALGFEPEVSYQEPVGQELPLEVALEAVAVLREALSNVARHARADRVEVEVTVGNELALRVVDNGVGIREPGRLSGIANARARAELLGGRLRLSAAKGGGTCFDWRVPLGARAKDQGAKDRGSESKSSKSKSSEREHSKGEGAAT